MHDERNLDCVWNYPGPVIKGSRCSCPEPLDEERIGLLMGRPIVFGPTIRTPIEFYLLASETRS